MGTFHVNCICYGNSYTIKYQLELARPNLKLVILGNFFTHKLLINNLLQENIMAFSHAFRRYSVVTRDDLEQWMEKRWSQLLALVSIWQLRAQSRHDLASLDSNRLNDIGLTRQQVEQEIHKAFWQA